MADKYTQADRDGMAKAGQAMSDGSYPIKDEEDLKNAVLAVGRGGADHDAIRQHVMDRAKALELSNLIPENWQADGSLKQTNSLARTKKPRHRSGPSVGVEVRHFAAEGLEVRESSAGGDTVLISGSPIVYNVGYRVRDMYGEFEETMLPGVASDLIGRSDTRFLFNHGGLPLARSTSGTLTLTDTPKALTFTAELDTRQSVANDLLIAIERGDVTQMSVGMVVGADTWSANDTKRSISRLSDLLDVSGVTYPASPSTDIAIAQRMMAEVPVESRARVRRMWSMSRDLRSGRQLTAAEADMLSDGLEALAEVEEDRAAPTDVDKKMPSKLSAIHSALQDAITTQMKDPDNGTDPDDVGLFGHLKAMHASLIKAQELQGADGTPDSPPVQVEETEGSGDGSGDTPVPDPAVAQDGTGSRSAELDAEERDDEVVEVQEPIDDGATARANLALELELMEIRKRRNTAA